MKASELKHWLQFVDDDEEIYLYIMNQQIAPFGCIHFEKNKLSFSLPYYGHGNYDESYNAIDLYIRNRIDNKSISRKQKRMFRKFYKEYR